ncbi:hypothetical protein [Nocardiopsis alkaliphila]|uniref:hypothetical protein n=1 Tax=Nocardiopsis alkaliphila TaxID=225762 RepID=UPI00034AF05D|nr:hypothetical protein [Nocardiopsis alkaliphila]
MVSLRVTYAWHRPLMAMAFVCMALLLVSGVGLLLDGRTINGESIWLKPAKFALSIAVYNTSLAWLLHLTHRWRRTAWWLGTLIAVVGVAEMGAIIIQAARGRMSHFNAATPLDSMLYGVMGVMITTLWVATLGIAVLLMRQRVRERSTTWAIRIGVGIALLGMGVGPLMTQPTPEQANALAGGGSDVIGAHTVGLPDGGPGLPVVGWSTVAGDLRVGHFVGMHGLQVMVLLALLLVALSSRSPRFADDDVRCRLVAVAGALYLGLTGLTVWQALRGQPVVAPDALTLAAAGGLVVLAVLGAVWAVRVSSVPTDREEQACGSSSISTTSSTRGAASIRP